ncbi:MAG: DNA gyrase inhibitor YacG [Gammaproteobacteria bacterium]
MMRSVACPTCGKSVEWSEAQRWRPFCSERCRLIDLGDWLSNVNIIHGDTSRDLDPLLEPQEFPPTPRGRTRRDTED